MVNFGALTAESGSLLWGTTPNFNGFRVLAVLLRGTLVVGVSQKFGALNNGRYLHSAGRPSRSAWAHILVRSFYMDVCHLCIFTFCVSRRQRKMYCGHARLCVCLSVRGRTPTLLHGPGCNLGAW